MILWVLFGAACLAIPLIRWIAPDLDFALANLFTAGCVLLAWILGLLAIIASPLPRLVWQIWLGVPVLLGGIFLACLKFERLDGELQPQFSLRWQQELDLPTLVDGGPADSEKLSAPRPTDFPQFLGPGRNARVRNVSLNPDWTSSPPEIIWQQVIGDGWSGFAVQGDLAVTMEQRDEEEWVTAYSVLDGRLVWHYSIDAMHTNVLGGTGPRSTPLIYSNRVYACSAVSQLVCLDLATGALHWSQDLLELAATNQEEMEIAVAWGRSGSALIVDQRVVVPLGGKAGAAQTLIAFDVADGREVWRSGIDQISYASPSLGVLNGVEQILYVSEKQLGGYAKETGKLLWSTPWDSNSNSNASASQPVELGANRLLISKGYGVGAQLLEITHRDGRWNSNVVWENSRVLRTKFTSCVVRDGYAYGLSDGILECVDLEDGKRAWKRGRYRQGQLLLVGEYLLISAEDGALVLVAADPEEFRELARIQAIGKVTWNTLTLSGNRVLIRNSDEVACIEIPVVSTANADSGSRDSRDVDEMDLNSGRGAEQTPE